MSLNKKNKFQEIHTEINKQQEVFNNNIFEDSQQKVLSNDSGINMPVNLNKAQIIGNDDDDFSEDGDVQVEKQKESVALNGTYQKIDKKVDGHYMTSLKKELNKESALRLESGNNDIPAVDYTTEQIEQIKSAGTVGFVKKKLENVVSICKKYRFFHPWPMSKEGKKRKADVIAVQKKAEERINACKKRQAELKEEEKAATQRMKERLSANPETHKTATDEATSGLNNVKAYAKTIAGFTLGNIWNTVGMIPSAIIWAFASGVKSLIKRKWSSAYHILHPHSAQTWHNTVVYNQADTIERRNLEKEGEKKFDDAKFEFIYNDPSYRTKMSWHHYLAMK